MSAGSGRGRRRRRGWTAAVLTVVLGVGLAGCGDDDPFARYCDEVADQQRPLTEAAAAGPTRGLLQALPSFRALQEKSPDDIADEWAVVVQRLTVLDDALEAADVDATTYDPAQPLEDLSGEDAAAIRAAASGLVTEAMRTALDAVQQQSRDVCKTPLSL
ncbi:MAG: hypothetical protein KKA97_04220 [Actinobacteria bacterium]|nr:hypothetical protein [Actinomycetota bacterium]